METKSGVPFFRHGLRADDAGPIADVLATPFLTSAGVGRQVEARLCDFFGVAGAKLTNSWTNGAIATLLAMGIGPGDEVIVPAMTFIASVNIIEILQAKPVFVDVDPETQLVDLAAVAKAITSKTRAIIPVHLYGQMVDMEALRDLCGKDIRLLEDCAHCFEGTLRGHRPGEFSDAAVFSFYATKNVTCGEGGAVITNDEALFARLKQTMLHGMSAGADRRFENALYRHWEMNNLGVKANLPDLLAALLPAQIDIIAEKLTERTRLVARYREALDGQAGIQLLAGVPDCVSAHHLFPIAVPMGLRDQVLHDLNVAGVGTTVNYRAVHEMGYYASKYDFQPDDYPVASDWGQRTLSLPLFPGLRDEEQDYVVSSLKKIITALI
ncbi:DegT/DnrJ/EryC1/StrS aminotransferase family protein [Ruegeria sp. Ofav3-42]|uniref:DegT/DnrJ/EryC1/StrS family aminotransferase n=1 Tax=Ruegeria sp. Ofav3-42 TaxID=2917759 RepID=UPI001EF4FB68|nr:DegT/DnrJ/EryC1/StrS family aminotransferase [Ruegeria sp. Ofav3-42]MCG7522022.1 DegT/DnrJ/EryC1/StrS family aminotransferase [Ruegeria sp. Ofav3-42]